MSTQHVIGAYARKGTLSVVLACLAILIPNGLLAERPARDVSRQKGADGAQRVELFAAIESGQIDVRLIPSDSTKAKVIITNKTDKPLSVRLPDVFAGVPVLAQQPLDFWNPQQTSNTNISNGLPQSIGASGNPNSNNNAFPDFFNNNGMFNIAPEKVAKISVVCVCLEHGKPDPRSTIPYKLVPLESVAANPAVEAVLGELSRGKCSRRVAQAAVWHLNNEMTWKQVADVRGPRSVTQARPLFFSSKEIRDAKELVAGLNKAAQTPSQTELTAK